MQQLDPTTDTSFLAFLPGQPQEDDRSLVVRFFVKPKLMGFKSTEAGREIYEDREYIEIRIKGQDKQVVIEEVTAKHKQKYPIAYTMFLHQKPQVVVGTPIEQLPGVGPSLAHNLKGMNLRTIEDLAGISDENTLQAIGMGARDLVKRAKAFLDKSTSDTVAMREQMAAMQKTIDELKASNAKPPKPPKASKKQRAEAPA